MVAVVLQLMPVGQYQVLQVADVAHVVQGEVCLDLQVLVAGGVGGAFFVAGAFYAPDGAACGFDECGFAQLVYVSNHDGAGAAFADVVGDAVQGLVNPVVRVLGAAVFGAPPFQNLARAAGGE